MVDANIPSKTAEAGHELRDLEPKRIALFAVALVITITVVFVVAYALLQRFLTVQTKNQPVPSPLSYTREPVPEPHLQVNPGQELKTMMAAEDTILKSYDWIDQDKGIVRIPIDRAIEILAERGLPARSASDSITSAVSQQKAPSPRNAATKK